VLIAKKQTVNLKIKKIGDKSMAVKKIKNPITQDEIELISHPSTRNKYMLEISKEFPEKSYDEIVYMAELKARKTGYVNPFIIRAKQMEEFRKKYSAD